MMSWTRVRRGRARTTDSVHPGLVVVTRASAASGTRTPIVVRTSTNAGLIDHVATAEPVSIPSVVTGKPVLSGEM